MALRVIVRRESADYIQCDSYTSASGLPPALLEPLSVWQRTLLHIPPPGHAYWTADTGDSSHCTWGVERRGEFSGLGSLAGRFLALGSGLGLVGTASSRR